MVKPGRGNDALGFLCGEWVHSSKTARYVFDPNATSKAKQRRDDHAYSVGKIGRRGIHVKVSN